MQPKSTRGVQARDVHQAADQLIADGQRPTIERIRLKLGRGSPNTIAPLLDAWFNQLAPRLGMGTTTENETMAVPTVVSEAAQAVWQHALASATAIAEQHIQERAAGLQQQREALQEAHGALDLRATQLADRERHQQQAMDLLQQELAHWKNAAQAEQAKTAEEQTQLRLVRQALAESAQERSTERRRHDEQIQSLMEEQRRQVQGFHADQQRLLVQVDQEREQAKRLAKRLTQAQESRDSALKESENTHTLLRQRLHEAQLEISALQARRQVQDEHVTQLRARLLALELKQPARKRTRATNTN